MKRVTFVSLALIVLLVTSAAAHHNMSAVFDLNQRFAETGTLTEIDWRNPHVHFVVDVHVNVQGDENNVESWSFEGPAPGFFRSSDARIRFESSIGKTVTVEASRARDGSRSGLLREITLADGTVLSACPQNC